MVTVAEQLQLSPDMHFWYGGNFWDNRQKWCQTGNSNYLMAMLECIRFQPEIPKDFGMGGWNLEDNWNDQVFGPRYC